MKKISRLLLAAAILTLFARATFAQSAMPKVGEKAPDFALPDQNGKIHRLSDYKGKILLLAFYPADFTKGCTLEAHINTEHQNDYKAAGITVFGISVQTAASHKAFCQTEGIRYTLLADSTGKVASEYGVLGGGVSKFPEQAWYNHPKQYAALYAKTNPHPVNGLANRATFIVGRNGRIAYIDTAVDDHLRTCAQDWISWVKQHRAELDRK